MRSKADIGLATLLAAAWLLAVTPGGHAAAAGRDIGPRPAGQFDYYVLSLSWVPGFCATSRGHFAECRTNLGFALHGLWPQLNGGDYPTDCDAVGLSQGEIKSYQGLYAAPSLIVHEWTKHGTCSGLLPVAYFALTARDAGKIRISDAYGPGAVLTAADARTVKTAFVAANPGLSAADLTVVAVKGVVTEVDICLTKGGAFRSC